MDKMIHHRRRRQWLPGAGLVAVAICATAAVGCSRARMSRQSRDAQQLLKQTAATYAGLQSFSERTTIHAQRTYSGEVVREVTKTRFLYRQPNLIYYEKQGDRSLVWACDGTRLISYDPETNTYQQGTPPPDLAQFFRAVRFDTDGLSELALLIGAPWEAVLTNVRLGKVSRVEGATTQAVSGDIVSLVGGRERKGEARQTLWIDKKTYLIRRSRVVIRRDDESTQWTETMHEVEADPDLPDERFRWSPPPGAKPEQPARPSLPPPQRP